MAGSLNLEDRINEVRQRLSSPEQVLGKELIQPFPTSSSGSRKIMYSVHSEQAMALCNPFKLDLRMSTEEDLHLSNRQSKIKECWIK